MNTAEIKALDEQYVVHTYARSPFVVERGEGVYLYDTDGKAYLDFVSGIAVNALGYGDPDVLRAMTEQAKQLTHVSNLYHTAPQAQLAKMRWKHPLLTRCTFAIPAPSRSSGDQVLAQMGQDELWREQNRFCDFLGRVSWAHDGVVGADAAPALSRSLLAVDAGRASGYLQRSSVRRSVGERFYLRCDRRAGARRGGREPRHARVSARPARAVYS